MACGTRSMRQIRKAMRAQMGIAAPKQRNLSLLDDLAAGWFQNQNLISDALVLLC
jgi:hypothetical protein